MPTEKRAVSFRIDVDLLDGLYALRERDGMNTNEAARRALRAFLKQKGVLVSKAPGKPIPARKRARTRR
jgi:hypothetical protein